MDFIPMEASLHGYFVSLCGALSIGGMGAKGKGSRINVIHLIVRWYCSSLLSLALGEKAIKGG